MEELAPSERASVLGRIKSQAAAGAFSLPQHAHKEMVEEEISLDALLAAIQRGEILEEYPQHRRGACCLVSGQTAEGRPLHVVCTTAQPVLILITVYEPRPPKWLTPWKRRGQP
jgi:hypothetical protein